VRERHSSEKYIEVLGSILVGPFGVTNGLFHWQLINHLSRNFGKMREVFYEANPSKKRER
jgi:hypothetical protein